jgi:uncharacterized membrane protein YjgN (DUF898 family)
MAYNAIQAAGAETVTLRFSGGALSMFGRVLLAALCTFLILPAAWGVVPFVRWFIEHLEWSDGTQTHFEGEPGEVWYLFALSGLIGYIPLIAPLTLDDTFPVRLGAAILTAILTPFVAVPIWRFYCRRTSIGQTADLTFDGSVPGYIGFTVLMQVAVYTIIGWAWVSTAMQRWLMSHIQSNDVRFEFVGSGLSLLWRALATGVACLFIIPIPWAMRWLMAWYVEQTVMHRVTALPTSFPSSFDGNQ